MLFCPFLVEVFTYTDRKYTAGTLYICMYCVTTIHVKVQNLVSTLLPLSPCQYFTQKVTTVVTSKPD